jgi:hypothetical protein
VPATTTARPAATGTGTRGAPHDSDDAADNDHVDHAATDEHDTAHDDDTARQRHW